jgi:hypothetical protein
MGTMKASKLTSKLTYNTCMQKIEEEKEMHVNFLNYMKAKIQVAKLTGMQKYR